MLQPCRLALRLGQGGLRQLSTSSYLLAKDYYKTLGVASNASGKDIKKAYYQLAKKYHPDTNKGEPKAEKLFQEVSEAYEVLGDDGRRADYDSFGGAGREAQGREGAGPRGGFEGFAKKAGEGNPFSRGGKTRGPGGQQWSYQSNVDPEELFKTIFGEFTRRQSPRGAAGGFQNPFDEIFNNFNFRGGQEATAHISFTEAARGTVQEVEVVRMSRSQGMEKVRVQVPIPAGIADGQTLRLSLGQGQEVFVTVRVEESDYFRREGQDVHTTASISLSQALLGGIIRVSGLKEEINLRIPAGTSSHTALTLSGRGIKHMESHSQHGDHIVHLTIKLPVRMTEEQLEIIREFALTEKDTPGTVTGMDRAGWSRRRDSHEGRSTSEGGRSSGEEGRSTGSGQGTVEARGTLARIADAIGQNETVVRLRKALGL